MFYYARVFGIFWKCARVGERLSPYVGLCCVVMAVRTHQVLWNITGLVWLLRRIFLGLFDGELMIVSRKWSRTYISDVHVLRFMIPFGSFSMQYRL